MQSGSRLGEKERQESEIERGKKEQLKCRIRVSTSLMDCTLIRTEHL